MCKNTKVKFSIRNFCVAIILIVSFGTLILACVNHCKAKNEFHCIMKKHEAAIDSLRFSFGKEYIDDSASIKDVKQSLEITAPKIEACSNWFFDNNTITFLVSFALVLLITLILDLQRKLRNEYNELTNEINTKVTQMTNEINTKVSEINTMHENNRLERERMREKYFQEYQDNVKKQNNKIEQSCIAIQEISESLDMSLDSQSKDNEEMLLKFEKRIDNIHQSLNESKEIVSNDMDSADISIQFKSLFLESLFFSLSLKFSDYEVNPKFAELVYYMDNRRNSIDNFLSQKRNFKIKSETQNDIFESLINTIRNIEIVKIKKNTKNNGKTVLYEALVIDLEELLKKVRKLNINDTLYEYKK